MAKTGYDLSIKSKGLKYKITIAFCLMSVLPVLVFLSYISNSRSPYAQLHLSIFIFTFVACSIAILGYFLVRGIVNRILLVVREAKRMAQGDVSSRIEVSYPDEVGALGETLNQLAEQIQKNMRDLAKFNTQDNQTNGAMQKHVCVFSNLLQISSLISQGVALEEVVKMVAEKACLLGDSDSAFVFFKQPGESSFYLKAGGGKAATLDKESLTLQQGPLSEELAASLKALVVDKNNNARTELASTLQRLKVRNLLSLPITIRGVFIGILAIGNNCDGFLYEKDDAQLLDIFAKQVAIALENDQLLHRVERLEIRDTLTGLYNKRYILERLEEEIRRAIVRQRPCSFVLLSIDHFDDFCSLLSLSEIESKLKAVASLIRDSVTEIDRVAHFDECRFAIVLPEKNKRQAQELAAEIKKKIEGTFLDAQKTDMAFTVSGAVSENPLDGITADELFAKACESLAAAENGSRSGTGINP